MTVVEQSVPGLPVVAYETPAVPLPKPEKRVAALDGIRGIAVLLVMFGHAGFRGFNGAIGVDVFFVLSGYLITAILLNELKKSGRLNFFNFYMRRILRLFPALLLLVVLYLIASAALGKKMGRAFGDAGITLGYASNWTRAFGDRPLELGHTWSLSIEEQFYVLWPAIVVGIYFLSTKVRKAVAGAVVGLSRRLARSRGSLSRRLARLSFKAPAISATLFGLLVCLFGALAIVAHRHAVAARMEGNMDAEQLRRNFYRIYYALDTRGDSLLFGAALAFWTPKVPKWIAAIIGWTGVLAVAWVVLALQAGLTVLLPGGQTPECVFFIGDWQIAVPWILKTNGYPFTDMGIYTLAILVGLLNYKDGLLAWLLSFPPLVWVGVISYGLYLYHHPIVTWMRIAGWEPWKMAVVGLGLAFVIATISFYALERPCLRLKDRFRSAKAA